MTDEQKPLAEVFSSGHSPLSPQAFLGMLLSWSDEMDSIVVHVLAKNRRSSVFWTKQAIGDMAYALIRLDEALKKEILE